ncbi:hypothetical protein SLE2022_049690 [Rubroshorea leprosula]
MPLPLDILVVIFASFGLDLVNLIPPASQSSPSPEPPLKSFKDTLIDGSVSTKPPLVTYKELVAANLNLESLTPMVKNGVNPPKPKIPKVKIPKSIWQRLCAP